MQCREGGQCAQGRVAARGPFHPQTQPPGCTACCVIYPWIKWEMRPSPSQEKGSQSSVLDKCSNLCNNHILSTCKLSCLCTSTDGIGVSSEAVVNSLLGKQFTQWLLVQDSSMHSTDSDEASSVCQSSHWVMWREIEVTLSTL